jgi:hypothetical protein
MPPSSPRLIPWKRSFLIIGVCIATIAFRTWQSYEKKGFLDWIDYTVAVVSVFCCSGIICFVTWYGNKPE